MFSQEELSSLLFKCPFYSCLTFLQPESHFLFVPQPSLFMVMAQVHVYHIYQSCFMCALSFAKGHAYSWPRVSPVCLCGRPCLLTQPRSSGRPTPSRYQFSHSVNGVLFAFVSHFKSSVLKHSANNTLPMLQSRLTSIFLGALLPLYFWAALY